MSRRKVRLHRTQLDNLISNLRGEVGEVITSWLLYRWLRQQAVSKQTKDIAADLSNSDLNVLSILVDRLRNELVARLSELAETKIGRLNFHFAAEKLGRLRSEAAEFSRFVDSHHLREKRNYDISHKELPERWERHRHIHVPYRVVLGALARALRLMKQIDQAVLGPSSKYLWREMRKKRYELVAPPKVAYIIMPHIRLSPEDRARIVAEEAQAGEDVWAQMATTINGAEAKVLASKKWGVIALGSQLIVLGEYPLQQIGEIKTT